MYKAINAFFHPTQFVVNAKGKKLSVIIDLKTYEGVARILEDHYDNSLIDETLGEETYPWEEVKAELDLERNKGDKSHVR